MCGSPRTRNNNFDASRLRASGILLEKTWCSMSADDPALMGDLELREGFMGMAHRFPIGLAAHDDAHKGQR
jgi:hypothetical protein